MDKKTELTLEQALNNIQIVLEQFVGKKADHVVLEQSLNKIKESIK
jgi:hypothetical protein